MQEHSHSKALLHLRNNKIHPQKLKDDTKTKEAAVTL